MLEKTTTFDGQNAAFLTKKRRFVSHLHWNPQALHEAVRHSPRPDRFDFSETVFPSDPDRQ